jgi:hypothetical protein
VPAAAIDPRELHQVLGSFVTGVTVITTVDESGRWWGLTAVGDARTTDVDADSAPCQRLRAAASQLSARLGFNTSQRPDLGAARSFKGAP